MPDTNKGNKLQSNNDPINCRGPVADLFNERGKNKKEIHQTPCDSYDTKNSEDDGTFFHKNVKKISKYKRQITKNNKMPYIKNYFDFSKIAENIFFNCMASSCSSTPSFQILMNLFHKLNEENKRFLLLLFYKFLHA